MLYIFFSYIFPAILYNNSAVLILFLCFRSFLRYFVVAKGPPHTPPVVVGRTKCEEANQNKIAFHSPHGQVPDKEEDKPQ